MANEWCAIGVPLLAMNAAPLATNAASCRLIRSSLLMLLNPQCWIGSAYSDEHAEAPLLTRLLRATCERPRCRRAAECGQQFPPSDGDCHTPLPREVRKGQRYHATSALSLTARHPARAGGAPGTRCDAAPTVAKMLAQICG